LAAQSVDFPACFIEEDSKLASIKHRTNNARTHMAHFVHEVMPARQLQAVRVHTDQRLHWTVWAVVMMMVMAEADDPHA